MQTTSYFSTDVYNDFYNVFFNFTSDLIDRTHVLYVDPYSKYMCLRYLYFGFSEIKRQ